LPSIEEVHATKQHHETATGNVVTLSQRQVQVKVMHDCCGDNKEKTINQRSDTENRDREHGVISPSSQP
ncbi:hypothetical protein CGH67_30625, partial [Vibrio parahaemolyticus]